MPTATMERTQANAPAHLACYRAGVRIGAQEPRIRVENGSVAYTDGPDAAILISLSKIELFPWQRTVVDAWCSRDENDRPSYTTCGLSVSRQNGKNLIIEAFEIYKLAVDGAHILHTAHRVRTAKESFTRLVNHFNERVNPELAAMVEKIRYTNGEESITLKNGGRIEFSARSRAGTRGFADIQVVVFDEAQDLEDEQLAAIMFTLAASSTGDRQMIFTGTPPDPRSPGTVFARRRLAAIADEPSNRTCWHEWGVIEPPEEGATFSDVLDMVYETNPSMGLTLDQDWTEDEFANASIDDFARERLGWWASTAFGVRTAFAPEEWDACRNERPKKVGPATYSISFSPDGRTGSMAVCHRPSTGPAFVYVHKTLSLNNGIGWFVDALSENWRKAASIVIEGQSNAQTLQERLIANGVPKKRIVRPNASDVIAANASLLNAVREHSITHYGQPALDQSATECEVRDVGKNGGWDFVTTDHADATLIKSAALALWGAAKVKRTPTGKGRIGC